MNVKVVHQIIQDIQNQLDLWVKETNSIKTQDVLRFLYMIKKVAQKEKAYGILVQVLDLINEFNSLKDIDCTSKFVKKKVQPLVSSCRQFKEDKFIVSNITLCDSYEKTTILLYTNDSIYLHSLIELFDKLNWNYIATNDSRKVIAATYQYKPSCILLGNDENTIDIIKRTHTFTKELFIPTVLLGNQFSKVTNFALQVGFYNTISDPSNLKNLVHKVNNIMKEKHYIMKKTFKDWQTNLYNEEMLKDIFDWQQMQLERINNPFTLVLVDIADKIKIKKQYGLITYNRIEKHIAKYLQQSIRGTDLLFSINEEGMFAVLLPNSGSKEANIFLNRVLMNIPNLDYPLSETIKSISIGLLSSFSEVLTPIHSYSEIMELLKKKVYELGVSEKEHFSQVWITQDTPIREIKISVIEDDETMCSLLDFMFDTIKLEGIQVKVEFFRNGESFINSDWYQSSHKHIVLTESILPKKNGIEIVQFLRDLPNADKYLIVMFSHHNADHHVVYAYEQGVDEYIIKPFSIKILESKIKRLLQRLK